MLCGFELCTDYADAPQGFATVPGYAPVPYAQPPYYGQPGIKAASLVFHVMTVVVYVLE